MSGPASTRGSSDLPARAARLFRIAELQPGRAVRLARRWHAWAADLSPLDQALAAYELGYALLCWERFAEAGELLAEAEARLQALGAARLALHVRRALLFLTLLRGGHADHAEEWAELAARYEQQGDALSAARARLGQMGQLNNQGLAQAALDLAARVRPGLQRPDDEGDRAWLERIVGVALINSGAFEPAQRSLDAAVSQFTALNSQVEVAKSLFERSRLHLIYGDFVAASKDLERGYRFVMRLDLPLRVAFCEKNLGWLAALRGAYDQGIRLSLQAYERLAALGRLDRMADCDLNLGSIAYFAGLPDLALAAYQRAAKTYAALDHQQMHLLSRRNQALALRLRGQPAAALGLLDELLPVAERLGERYELAAVTQARGEVLADLGEVIAALRAFEAAEEGFQGLKSSIGTGWSRTGRGWLLLRQGDLEQAQDCFQTARPLLHEQPIYQWRIDYGLGRCAELRGDLRAALSHYRGACLIVARLRQRLANEHASSGLFAQAEQLVEDAIQLSWRLRDAEAALELTELQRSLTLVASLRQAHVQSIAQEMPASLSAASKHTLSGPDPGFLPAFQEYLERRLRNRHIQPIEEPELLAPLDLPRLRSAFDKAFPQGWTLLTYIPCQSQLLIVMMDEQRLTIAATLFDKRLRWLLKRATAQQYRWLTYMAEATAGEPEAATWQISQELGERLIPAQLHERVSPERRLLIVAGGPLHGLPWAALRLGGTWLVERFTPQLLPGLLSWQQLVPRRSAGNAGLLIGVSDFGGRAPELGGTGEMLELIADRWPGPVTRLEEEQLSVSALLDRAAQGELRRYGLIHFFTHGQMVATSGLLAHLKLAHDDLHYDQIARLNLAGALVVLAACEGAAAEVMQGEEILSLSRAFLIAGARDVIASEWQLYDTVAPPLFALLYDALARGLDAPASLAWAQREWLRQPADSTSLGVLASAPLVWAGLTALGAGAAPPGA